MRRWRGAVLVTALVTALLTGCGTPPAGTDGDLFDDWSAFPVAEQFVPRAGICQAKVDPVGYLSSYLPVDCAGIHQAETVYVGRFSDPWASRPNAPAADSLTLQSVFPDCDARVQRFVGANWRGARLSVRVVPPSPQGWAGGERWYRCDVFMLARLENSDENQVDQTGSLRGALAKASPLSYGCFNEDKWTGLHAIACDKPHHYEYAGVFNTRLATLDQVDENEDALLAACALVVTTFVNFRIDQAGDHRLGDTYLPPSAQAWARGDRGIRCLLYADRTGLTRSLKGAGPAALPR